MAAVGGIQDTSYLYSAYEWVTEHPVFSVTLPLFTAIGAYFSTSGEYLPLLLLPIVWYNTVNQETRVNRVLLECQEKNRTLKAQLDPQPKKKTSCDPRQLSPSRGFLENPAVWIRSHPISTVTIPAIYYYGSFVVHKTSTLAEYPTDGTLGTHFRPLHHICGYCERDNHSDTLCDSYPHLCPFRRKNPSTQTTNRSKSENAETSASSQASG